MIDHTNCSSLVTPNARPVDYNQSTERVKQILGKKSLYVPEEAAVIDDTSTVGSRAVADLRLGGGETSNTVCRGEVVPALHHGIDRGGAAHLLCSREVFVAAAVQLCT